eukprot:2730631-Karenia_brevis.AAC.1
MCAQLADAINQLVGALLEVQVQCQHLLQAASNWQHNIHITCMRSIFLVGLHGFGASVPGCANWVLVGASAPGLNMDI